MSAARLEWRGTREALAAVDTYLSEIRWPPADAVSLVKDDPSEADTDSDWRLMAYFEQMPDVRVLMTELSAAGFALDEPIAETLPDIDWVAHALEGLGVVEAGGFVLYGSHDRDKVLGRDGHLIQIEANRAFGTGHHPTTAGCLEALGALADTAPRRVLDLGTGSGILAIAARRLWPDATIIATDIDTPSIEIAAGNADLNEARGIDFIVADGIDAAVRALGPFDLVLANILAEPLISLADDVASALVPDGMAVLAGLLARQEEAVRSAYETAGFVLTARQDGAWPVLRMRRGG
jgi:ribosomal protein L11 methyltransferase